MKKIFQITKAFTFYLTLTICLSQHISAQESQGKFIHIEWEKNSLASEYHLQISDSIQFFDVIYEKKTKEALIRLDPNPRYRYGRIAGIDQFGVRGEFSEIFEIEQRIIEEKPPEKVVPLPANFLGENHLITLDVNEDKESGRTTFYRVNEGKWLTYHDGIQLSKQGPNQIQYFSDDKLGNRERTKTMDYILDTEAPFVEMIFTNTFEDKGKFTYTGKNSKIELRVSDNYSGILSVKTFLRTIDESKEIEWDPKKEFSIPKSFSQKIVELLVVATDRLGNVKTYSKFFKHDLLPPDIAIETKVKMDGAGRRTVINHISGYDSFSGVQHIFYILDNSGENVYLEPILISEPGEHELKVYAVDNVGNKSNFQFERIYIAAPPKKKDTPENK